MLGLDVAPDGAFAAIVAVGERDGHLHAAALDHGEGTDWLMGAVERRFEESGNAVYVDERRVADFLPELEQITGFRVRQLGTRDVTTAAEFFLRLCREGRFHHRGEPELAAAVASAAQRPVGDGWAWSRRKSGADISPLCAITWACDLWRHSWTSDQPEEEYAPL